MKKVELEKGVLREIFNRVDKVEEYVRAYKFRYPVGSNIFSSSFPQEIDHEESVMDYLDFNVQKLKAMSEKLEVWLDVYKKKQYRNEVRDVPRREDFGNLSVKELYLAFMPKKANNLEPYDERSIPNLINRSNIVNPVASGNSKLYSVNDFEKMLNETNLPYDGETSREIVIFFRDQGRSLTKEGRENGANSIRKRIKLRRLSGGKDLFTQKN